MFSVKIPQGICRSRTTIPQAYVLEIMKQPSQTQMFFTLITVFANIKQMFIEDSYAVFNVCKHWTNHVIDICVLAGRLFQKIKKICLHFFSIWLMMQMWKKCVEVCLTHWDEFKTVWTTEKEKKVVNQKTGKKIRMRY